MWYGYRVERSRDQFSAIATVGCERSRNVQSKVSANRTIDKERISTVNQSEIIMVWQPIHLAWALVSRCRLWTIHRDISISMWIGAISLSSKERGTHLLRVARKITKSNLTARSEKLTDLFRGQKQSCRIKCRLIAVVLMRFYFPICIWHRYASSKELDLGKKTNNLI